MQQCMALRYVSAIQGGILAHLTQLHRAGLSDGRGHGRLAGMGLVVKDRPLEISTTDFTARTNAHATSARKGKCSRPQQTLTRRSICDRLCFSSSKTQTSARRRCRWPSARCEEASHCGSPRTAHTRYDSKTKRVRSGHSLIQESSGKPLTPLMSYFSFIDRFSAFRNMLFITKKHSELP